MSDYLDEGDLLLSAAAVTICDLNGYWIDADTDAALDLVREVGRGVVEVRKQAEYLEAWALPKD